MKNILSHLAAFQTHDIDWMTAMGQLLELTEGQALVHAGCEPGGLYILLSGSLAVQLPTNSLGTSTEEFAQLSPGELVGDLCFIDQKRAAITTTALEFSQVLAIPKQILVDKVSSDTAFATGLYQTLAIHLSNKLRALSDLLARDRVASSPSLQKVLFVFAILNDNDLAWMITNGKREQITEGTAIIEAGAVVESVSILLEGTLGIFIPTVVEGKRLEPAVAKSIPGEILGEMSFIQAGKASATVRALEDCLLLTLPQALLNQRMQADSGFQMRFYRAITTLLADRLRTQIRGYELAKVGHPTNAIEANSMDSHQELDLTVLENTTIAGMRFDWMFKRLMN
ncbi:MAG: cyclic nucleotide-binding domain-containing protein [Microcoleaceae cyanobacterium]